MSDPRDRSSDDLVEARALAAACAAGDAEAVARFDARYGADILQTLRGMRLTAEVAADLKQQIYAHLFVAAPGGRPKIADYEGRGALGAWLRVVVVRTALNSLRKRVDAPLDDAMMAMIAAPDDPALELMKRTYRTEFRDAFREALTTLEAREQNLLKHVVLDGLDAGRIGRLYNVHRTTAMRWIDAAHASVRDRTRDALTRRLRIDAAELDSILRLIESQLEVGLSAIVGSADSSDDDAD